MRVEVPSSRDAAVALRRAAPEECVARLRELRGQSLELNVFHAASVLTACRGQWRWALEVLGELEGLAVEGDDVSSSAAVACCRDHWEMALALLMHFHRQNTWNLRTHGAVLSACAAAQRWQDAWSLLTWLEDAELQADVVSYGTAINACDWQQALKLLEVMESKRCEANQVCYTAAMTSGPPWPVVLQLFTAKRADRPALNAALSALARARERSLCLELLRSVRSADRSSYNIAITACGEDGWPWALHLLHELGDDADVGMRMVSNVKLGFGNPTACGNAGRWDVALSLVHEFRPVLNTFAFAALLMACGNAQRWQTAVLLLGTSEDFSVESNAFCYSAAISACGKASEWPHAVALLGRSSENNGFVEPNEICLNAALSACERAACWRQALLLASQSPRTDRGQLGDGDAAGLHVLLCCAERVGHWTLALSLLAQHPAVSASALDAACMACCRAQRWKEAIWLADELLEQPRPGKRLEVLAALKNVFERGHAQSQELLLGLAEHASSKEFPAGLPQVLRSAAAVERGDMKVLMVGLRQALGPIAATGRLPYQKEVALLRHVLRFAQFGRANEVEEAMDSFGGELGAAGGWAKFAGGSKADVLLHAVSGAPTSSILDVGAYCGGSALRLSRRFAGAHVVAIELDPTVAAMAKVLLSFAGLSSRVELRTGHSRQLLPQLKHRFGAVFLDLWGSQYAEVLEATVLVADNVLRTAAGEFLWRLAHHGAAPGFHTQVPPSIRELQGNSERWRQRATNVGMEPEEFEDMAQHTKSVKLGGAFHVGVEVGGLEWSYGRTFRDSRPGVVGMPPRKDPNHSFRQTVHLGYTEMSLESVNLLISVMIEDYPGRSYDVLRRTSFNAFPWLHRSVAGFSSMAASEERILLTATILDEESLTEENQQGKSNKWLVRGVSAVLVFAAVAALVLLKFTPPAASHVLHPQALYSAGIQSCAAGTMHQCPEDWKNPSQIMGYHCLHKLTRQTSEAAYQSSGGACRPASDGPFPEDDCQDQCSIGGEDSSSGSGGFGGSGSSGWGSGSGSYGGSWHHSGSFGSVWSSTDRHSHVGQVCGPARATGIPARMDRAAGTILAPLDLATVILAPIEATTTLAPLDLPGPYYSSSCIPTFDLGLPGLWPFLWIQLPFLWICLDLKFSIDLDFDLEIIFCIRTNSLRTERFRTLRQIVRSV
eukprot:g25665.t1